MDDIRCHTQLIVTALPGLPRIEPGDDLAALVAAGLARAEITPRSGDVLVVTSKVFSRAQNRFVDLSQVTPSTRAVELAAEVDKEPPLVELILRESVAVSRKARGVLIVRHRLGFVSANAGIDESNARPGAAAGDGPWALLLPVDPDASAAALRAGLRERFGRDLAVVITDSHGRPFRNGTVGVAIGVAGLPPLWDQRGHRDLDGRQLRVTVTALADQIAATADLVAGQANEGRPAVHIRGLSFTLRDDASATALVRPPDQDLYA